MNINMENVSDRELFSELFENPINPLLLHTSSFRCVAFRFSRLVSCWIRFVSIWVRFVALRYATLHFGLLRCAAIGFDSSHFGFFYFWIRFVVLRWVSI